MNPLPPQSLPRSTWAGLDDARLLAQCEVDTYRASGPGGQKRNKTSSAVRLRHPPTAIIVIAEESRSQHENKAKALRRLREALYLHRRDPIPPDATAETLAQHFELAPARNREGRLHLSAKSPLFWPAAGVVLDVLETTEGRAGETAERLDLTTANLVSFLATHPKLWQEANRIRVHYGLKPLRSTS